MTTELRKTGISAIGDVPWGTHFCHFYETKEDLLDILLPYFKTGLENNEFCMWVVADPLGEEEARKAFRQAIPDADRYLAAGHIEIVQHTCSPTSQHNSPPAQIEIIPQSEWYLKGGAFVAERVIDGWNEKLAEALAKGLDGMRANGNEAWLTEENRIDFLQYEKKLDEKLAGRRMIVLCSYPLSGSSAAEIFDVAHTHQFAVAKRRGNWEVVETTELKQAKAEINRLNEELEQRVVERTQELAAANEQLKKEIAQHWRAEDRIRLIIDTIPVMAWSLRPDGIVDFLNQRWVDYAGLSLEQYVADPTGPIHPQDAPRVMERWRALMALGEGYEDEMRLRRADGEYRWFLVRTAPLRDESGRVVKWYGVSTDIEDRKRVEEELKGTSEQLRALSRRLESAKEEEGARIARELHDELGSVLTGLKWKLESVEKICSGTSGQIDASTLREEFAGLTGRIDAIIGTVRRIASELRPGMLDTLGLVATIEWQAQQMEAQTGITCQVKSFIENTHLNPEQETAIFRITQEALTNVLRHAQASRVNITLKEDGEFSIQIRDNGTGITERERTARQSLGLIGMRERAHSVGGSIEITGVAGQGTVLTVRIPIS